MKWILILKVIMGETWVMIHLDKMMINLVMTFRNIRTKKKRILLGWRLIKTLSQPLHALLALLMGGTGMSL